MGIISSTASFTRFKIMDEIPKEKWNNITENLMLYAFQDIDNTSEESSHGWTCFEDMLDTKWNSAPPQKGEYIVFSLRLDTRRVPPSVLKKHLAIAIMEEKQKVMQQGKNFISRERKKELKEQVLIQLRQRFLPIPAEFNVVWSTTQNTVWFTSTQNKVIELFTELFTKTFDLHLDQMTPYGLASTFLNEAQLMQLDTLEPTYFAGE